MVPSYDCRHHVVSAPAKYVGEIHIGAMMRANEGKVIHDDMLCNPDLVIIPLPVA